MEIHPDVNLRHIPVSALTRQTFHFCFVIINTIFLKFLAYNISDRFLAVTAWTIRDRKIIRSVFLPLWMANLYTQTHLARTDVAKRFGRNDFGTHACILHSVSLSSMRSYEYYGYAYRMSWNRVLFSADHFNLPELHDTWPVVDRIRGRLWVDQKYRPYKKNFRIRHFY